MNREQVLHRIVPVPLLLLLLLSITILPVSAATPPNASFSANVTTGPAPLAVLFSDASLNIPTGWAWFFGDESWTAPAWTEVNASAGWSQRTGLTSVAMQDGSIVLMGGADNVAKTNDTWRSTDNGAVWTRVNSSSGWAKRYLHTSVALPDGSIVLMGGADSSYFNDVWRSADNGASWTLMNGSAGWSKRYSHSSVAMPDGSIVLMGGSEGSVVNDVWRSTDKGATWEQVNASAEWTARYGHTSVVMPDGSIVLMGGTDDSFTSNNEVWRSADNGNVWTQVNASAGWSARFSHTSVVMPDGSIVLMGGYDSNQLRDVWRSADNGNIWTQVNASAWPVRYEHSSVVMPDGSIVLMGGAGGGGKYNDVWQFQPANSSAQNPVHTYTAAGTYNVSLQVSNAAGFNSTRKAGYITVTVLTAPVASFSSKNISTATNTTTQGWAGAAPFTMMFNDTSTGPATSRVWNATNVTGNNVPFYLNSTTVTLANISYSFSTAGNYTIKLNATNSLGSSISTQVLWVNVSAAVPAFTSITPNTGTTAGGTTVTIAGTGLNGATGLTFGGTAATSFTVDSDTQITAVTPAKAAGAVNVVITTPGGTATGTGAYTYGTPTPTPTPVPSPVNGGSEGPAASAALVAVGAPAVSGKTTTTEVNVGGNSAVTQVTLTGTGISGAIVTGTVVPGPGPNTAPPAPLVYQYVDITPARYTTISGAIISFTVPVAWLTDHQLIPPDITLYHLSEQTWVALPTTLVSVKNGVAYYTAESSGFSRFAITGEAGLGSATTTAAQTPKEQTIGNLVSAPPGTITSAPSSDTPGPVTTPTTAIPLGPQPAPALPATAIAIAGGIVVLAAGGFLIRRWWIRKQNPSLFRDLD